MKGKGEVGQNNYNNNGNKNNSINILIGVLILAIVLMSGYIVYDKMINKQEQAEGNVSNEKSKSEDVSNDSPLVDENKDTSNLDTTPNAADTISNAEALQIGNDLFKYANGIFKNVKYKEMPTEDNAVDLGDDYGDAYEITNYDEIVSHFASDCVAAYWSEGVKPGIDGYYDDPQACSEAFNIVTKNGIHYHIPSDPAFDNINFAYFGQLRLISKTADTIQFNINYVYCGDDYEVTGVYGNNIGKNTNKCYVLDNYNKPTDKTVEPIIIAREFVIKKENNSWKIKKYYMYN